MRTILCLDHSEWNYQELEELLVDLKISKKNIRKGFQYYLIIEDSLILEDLNCSKNILIVKYDPVTSNLGNKGYHKNGNSIKEVPVNSIIEEKDSNLSFDLHYFGFIPEPDSDFKTIYNKIKNSDIEGLNSMLELFTVEELINNDNIDNKIKKYCIDIFALIATEMYIQLKLSVPKVLPRDTRLISDYSKILSLSFLTRAVIEKTILLASLIDIDINYKNIQSNKKIRKAFLNAAKKSNSKITQELTVFLPSVSLLDDNFRTPEIHKMSRVIGLINSNPERNVVSLINEVYSYYNEINEIFRKICNYLNTTSNPHTV